MKEQLREIREWAKTKIATGAEPPWSWYQYMKLVEVADAILKGMDSTSPMASSPQSECNSAKRLRLVDSTYQPDAAPRRPPDAPVQMPM
jgi:hypothetical protein